MGLTREQLWARLGILEVVAPIVLAGYEREAIRERRDGSGDSPHGQKWSSSFHSSSFPGDDPYACGRAAVYGLMDLPDPEVRPPRLTAWFDSGKELELNFVRRLAAEGVLLSADQTAGETFQTGFADREHWLTGASDAIILPPFWHKGHCVEVKQTGHEKVLAMREDSTNVPRAHAKYLRQLKSYIALANEAPFAPKVIVCATSWAITTNPLAQLRWCSVHESFECETREIQLNPPDDGTLIYSSREEPLTTASYLVAHDPVVIAAGRVKLAEWRDYFLRGEIPPHPREHERAKWSVAPCDWCPWKRDVCKPDYQAKIARLDESGASDFARSIRPAYDYAAHRAQVLKRWGARDLAEQKVAA